MESSFIHSVRRDGWVVKVVEKIRRSATIQVNVALVQHACQTSAVEQALQVAVVPVILTWHARPSSLVQPSRSSTRCHPTTTIRLFRTPWRYAPCENSVLERIGQSVLPHERCVVVLGVTCEMNDQIRVKLQGWDSSLDGMSGNTHKQQLCDSPLLL